MIDALELKLLDCPAGESSRVRCMCHVINLVVCAILKPFKSKKVIVDGKEALVDDDEDDDDLAEDGEEELEEEDYEPDPGRDSEDREIVLQAFKDVEEEAEIYVPEDDWKSARTTMRSTQRLTKRVHFSMPLRDELETHCVKSGLKYRTLKRTVATRWNTYAIMFASIIPMREAVKRLLRNHKDLPAFNADEWILIEQLEELLRPFVYLTEHMSGKTRPLIHEVIPFIDSINKKLETVIDNQSKLDCVRFAARCGRNILDKYYAKTDDSLVYRCAMSGFSLFFLFARLFHSLCANRPYF
ncbi:hypothetical protein K435DRAFT_673000 [Dendrothele bispora CBS 962.96]|uniref:hAT-like transposase RNase-H fold domain-containing protein n=1 Tax=Dendrothele bispora (strain CBS 962.96) TaxID=1314807 RepID=A0A4S8LST5_DENBC|nr:hypothetical protein K435DRAFT_673000 [Dendrothele bispora CBS 962.96]